MAYRDIMDRILTSNYTTLVVVSIVAICIFVLSKLRVTIHANEPPLLKPRVPFIGHVLGLLTGKMEYIGTLGLKHPELPILTVPLGASKLYIISSPQLVQAVYRSKAFSFDPMTIAFAEKMVGFGPNIVHLMHHPPSDGSIQWLHDQHKRNELLAPGPALYEMNVRVLESLFSVLNQLNSSFETKQLYMWLRDTFTVATTRALFGLENPLTQDPDLNDNLWDYETRQEQLLLTPFPSLFARKPFRARARLQQSLRKYFREGCDKRSDVAMIIKQRAATNRKWGLPIDDIADHELGMLFVAVTNAIPTMFWMVVHIFRDSQLVADLQEELSKVVSETKGTDGRCREYTFDVSTFSSTCPLLNSVYREVMRLTNRQMASRVTQQDVVLNYTPTDGTAPRQYLLKKDVPLLMPSMTTNFAEETWGKDSHLFEPRRFITQSREQERIQNRAANPFGGGKHLCPGRHFAYAEILGTVAALVLGFEIETPEGGRVSVPRLNNNLAEAVAKPLQEDQQGMLARIRKRPGWEDVKWCFNVGDGR